MLSDNCQKQTPFGKSIDVKVSVQAYIETHELPPGFPPDLHPARTEHLLRFDVTVNSNHVNSSYMIALFCIADGRHYGEQSGPEWEVLKTHWQSQYDYIAKHLPDALCEAALALQGEAFVSQKPGWDLSQIAPESDVEEIEEWADRHRDKVEKLVGVRESMNRWSPHVIVSYLALVIWDRLHGKADDGPDVIRVNQIGYIEPWQHKRFLDKYPEFAEMWRDIRAIIKGNRHDWAGIVHAEYGHTWPPPDLLDALQEEKAREDVPRRKKPVHGPHEIALVHLARFLGLLNKDGSALKVNQHQTVRDAINDYSAKAGKPRLRAQSLSSDKRSR